MVYSSQKVSEYIIEKPCVIQQSTRSVLYHLSNFLISKMQSLYIIMLKQSLQTLSISTKISRYYVFFSARDPSNLKIVRDSSGKLGPNSQKFMIDLSET